MNFSPDQMRMAQEMMKNPEQMKMAQNMMGNMSDDQIKNMTGMFGMNGMNPDLVRNASKNMDPNNPPNPGMMPPNMGGNPYGGNMPGMSPNMPGLNSNQSATSAQYSAISDLKTKGNNFFKKENYSDAAVTYFEGILEVEDILNKSNPKK